MVFKKALIKSSLIFAKSIQSKTNENDLCIIANKKMWNKQTFSIHFEEIIFYIRRFTIYWKG